MPTDVFYGGECDARIGVMADAATDPTSWYQLEFVSLRVTPEQPRKQRPKVGRARHNVLDPTKPVRQMQKVSAELVAEVDTRHTPRLLHIFLGDATSTGAGPYTHVWLSGVKTAQLACLQIQVGTGDIRIYRGLSLSQVSLDVTGEQTRDFDLKLSLRGIAYAKADAFIAGTVNSLPAENHCLAAQILIDDVAATNLLSASWTYDRNIMQEAFLSATPVLSGVRPGEASASGQAKMRANGEAFDDLEAANTVFNTKLKCYGVSSGEYVQFEHPACLVNGPPPMDIPGPGLIERELAWIAHQTSASAVAKITVGGSPVATYMAT